MTEVLSQDEIDQLLTVISAGDVEGEDTKQITDRKNIKIYDFKNPCILTKKELKQISDIFNKYAFLITLMIKEKLGNLYECTLCSVDQLTYKDYIRSIPSVNKVYKSMQGELKYIALELDKNLCDLSHEAFFDTLKYLVDVYNTPIDYTNEFKFYEDKQEIICLITFEITSPDLEGIFSLYIPAKELKTWLNKDNITKKENKMNFDINKIKTIVEASLGKATMSIEDINELGEGSIIALDRKEGDTVPIFVDGKQVGTGEVVLIDESFGVRITESWIEKEKQ